MFLMVARDGSALSCHTARMLSSLAFPNVRDIWFDSEGFNRYCGTGRMKEPCLSYADKEKYLGGCRPGVREKPVPRVRRAGGGARWRPQ